MMGCIRESAPNSGKTRAGLWWSVGDEGHQQLAAPGRLRWR